MLELDGHLKPRVLSALVDRNGGRRKGRICECADRHGNDIVAAFGGVVDGGTTLGAEAKRELRSLIPGSNVLRSRASDPESGTAEASLLTEYAARSPLTGETVTHRDSNRLSLHFDLELTAGT